ncbi:flippase-like domain-containing protein [candidate division KSB1 bacterium]|nr:flippase-like domain-containing protein [candidate division KSB1 bacterium]
MKNKSVDWKILLGLFISLIFLYLAFRKVDFREMGAAFSRANYWYLLPIIVILFLSHWLRAFRWKYFLAPIGHIKTGPLFSALIIGYMANTFVPAHLGDILRAFVIGRKNTVSSSAVFGTVVVERIVDVFSLLILMALTIIIFPFPDWIRKSGYITFAVIMIFSILLLLMKKYRHQGLSIMNKVLRFLPEGLNIRINSIIHSFLDGIVPLKSWKHYIIVFIVTILMWGCYALIFNLAFLAFDFVELYSLPWYASIVLLVITTISIAVPSSPGYVGTYHYLCQIGLVEFFNVQSDAALSFAFLAHGINMIPMFIAGLIFVSREGLSIKSLNKKPTFE